VSGANVSAVCRRLGISRKTGYKWLRRAARGGLLEDQSRRPHRSPRRTGVAMEDQVLRIREAHPAWGGRKITARLAALGVADVPAPSTITEILRRHGRFDPAASAAHRPFQRFERAAPNELWQMDFKGHVAMARGGRCHPLTVLDDHSRYAIGLWACADEREGTVRERLTAAFRRYGLPERVLCDNGSPWGDPNGECTGLMVWMLRLGVRVTHGRPCHPQTQGKDERFHRTLKAEVLSRVDLLDTAHAQAAFDPWRKVYNLERPHEALGMLPPASRYRMSERAFPEALPGLEYATGDAVRKVQHGGIVLYGGRRWRVGKAFRGEPVGVRATGVDGVVEVWYGAQAIATLDLREPPDDDDAHAGPPLATLAAGQRAEDPGCVTHVSEHL